MLNKLTDDYYKCVVVGGSNDIDHRGAVRVKVLGVTDMFDDEDQPYVYPALTGGMQQVPQKGYVLRVKFKQGDINQGYYYGMSQTPHELPPDFVRSYPDVAVANCGEDGFFYVHDRMSHTTTVTNPGNNCVATWDAAGFCTMECTTAYPQSGMGATDGTGANVQHVLTEGTIDIFTCMPVGHNRGPNGSNIGQGSEYLSVSHISQATIDAFHGAPTVPATVIPKSYDPESNSDIETRDIDDGTGTIEQIDFHPSDRNVKRSNKTFTRIILCHSQGENFPKQAKKSMYTSSSVHYLIGKVEGIPEVLGDAAEPTQIRNSGSAQFIELSDDGQMFGGSRIGGEKASYGAVIIMVVGGAFDNFTQYQRDMVNKIITHVRRESGNNMLPVVTPDKFDNPSISASMMAYTL